ncbi:MAG: hypothetical protein ACI8RD_014301, partial [Bacillariaceae sp.]
STKPSLNRRSVLRISGIAVASDVAVDVIVL